MKHKRAILIPVAILAVASTACGAQAKRGYRDAPIDQRLQDNTAPYVVNSPNTFPNLTLKCVGGDLLVTTTREAAPVIGVGASACKPGAAEAIGIPRVGGYVPSQG